MKSPTTAGLPELVKGDVGKARGASSSGVPLSSERASRASTARDVRAVGVGAGFAGIGAAGRLREAGFDDVLVLEKGTQLGGTWRENTYPGCACDVPSTLYSYSFIY